MAADARKRQKQLERKSAKRKSKHQLVSKRENAGLVERLSMAAKFPIMHCCAIGDISENGITSILLSRRLPNGSVAFATFLVDAWCLGIKNAHAEVCSNYQYQCDIVPKTKEATPMSPAAARKLVEDAAAYAAGIGFEPHADYRRAKAIFGDIDPTECQQEFQFGKDGKPFFFSGPHDDWARCRQIMSTLERTCGTGNYEVTLAVEPGSPLAELPPHPELE